MTDDRADGPTFALDDICWIDFETRSQTPIKSGAYRYATEADAIVLAYAIGDAPVHTLWVRDFTQPLSWGDLPPEFVLFYERVCCGEAVFAAWNAGFDRAIWNYATADFPELTSSGIIDVMAQATASGLPADLNYASKFSGSTHKMASGKSLIALFCLPDAVGTPQSHPDEWQAFLSYASGDIKAMRDIFRRTRQLPLAEWQEYWAMEAINSRGIAIDLKMAGHAACLAEEDRLRSRQALAELTGGAVKSVDQVKVMTEWLLAHLPPAGRDIILKREQEIDENQVITRPAKYSLTRKQVERLLAYLDAEVDNWPMTAVLDTLYRVLQLRLYGGSKTPAKFARMLSGHVDGVLYGQYVFNGAAQTGRASSKGVQIHNLIRDTLIYEHDAIEALLSGADYDDFSRLGDDSPVARKLSLLIRPAFVPSKATNVFVWSDWSQIEARALPWLCAHLAGARTRLDIFRDVDADPTLPDLYSLTAAQLSHVKITEVTKAMRQRGKVAELALGYMGGQNALQTMAAGYGMHFSDDEAQAVVDAWRAANPWAGIFARELWDAMLLARTAPGVLVPAGRISFCFLSSYLGGSLLCRLPSRRCLTYRALRREMVDEKDDDGKVIKSSLEWTYARGHGRQTLWPGIFVENCTQAVAADILRGTLVKLEQNGLAVRLHTHDEVLLEVAEIEAEYTACTLRWFMQEGFDWSKGLPLMSEETISPYYSKRA